MSDLPENYTAWAHSDRGEDPEADRRIRLLVAEVERLRARIADTETLIGEYMDDIPCFGPVDGTGKPDRNGELMVDVSVRDLRSDLKVLLHTMHGTTVPRPPRPPRSPR